ncbi:TPA: hypothetical protein N0F65_011388 [Lagenidium giganteum]|uniref:Uncharacterized protein n=1 Tax=Lagenidium giganteum TaxID=4803 RepID=A0AAV2Z869_9STRA|nr:TPA: hypothetical protein N0F65_011388 [Lagenidium giganteum]
MSKVSGAIALLFTSVVWAESLLGQWQCVGDITTPVRRFWSSDIECASLNGRDCLWQSDMASCNRVIQDMRLNAQSTITQPLRCGNHHRATWGSTGYLEGGHWCTKSFDLVPNYPPMSPWTCVNGVNVPLRVNFWGDVECMSSNRRDCHWKSSQSECAALIVNPPKLQVPLTCGDVHVDEHGTGGYGTANHWCRLGATFFMLSK